ncbi:MAG: type II toxin-antitoxin system VapB family antitoxin [Gammaproteobacteria bacterium]|nr:type II toxin-antitoxin system VapB family antitoxin [Gammaproteobacteria bacterium]
MSLNIKNEKTCRLADELARLTGETKTGAIAVVLEERLVRERRLRDREALLRDIRAIRKRCASLLGPGPPAAEHGDLLYDEQGLPR